jgi:hypothetical protein
MSSQIDMTFVPFPTVHRKSARHREAIGTGAAFNSPYFKIAFALEGRAMKSLRRQFLQRS